MTPAANNEAPARRRREHDRRRRAILDAATALFAGNGFQATTMQAVAGRAGVSVGYLYKHFAGKGAILEAIVAAHLDRLDELIREVEAQALPPLEEMRRTLEAIARHFDDHVDFMRIYHEELDAAVREMPERRIDHRRRIVRALEGAHARGELAAADFELVAAAIHGASRELFLAMAERDAPRPFAGLTDLLFRLLVDPLRRDPAAS